MSGATEWLVEHDDPDDIGTAYEHIASREDAVAYLRQLVAQGKTAALYQLVPFEAKIDVTLHAPRKRKRDAELAKPTPPPRSAPDEKGAIDLPVEEAAGDSTSEVEGAAWPHAADAQGASAAEASAPTQPPTAGAANPASPVSVFDCEARFDHDPVCPGPAVFDPATRGRFCSVHIAVEETFRREMHRLHGDRNRPLAPIARLAHVG